MKNISKFVALLMSIGLVLNQSGIVPKAKQLNSFAQEHGFELDESVFRDIGYTGRLTNKLYHFDKKYNCKVGETTSWVIFATDRKKPAGVPQKNIALYYHIVEPYGVTQKNDYYGGSDYLKVVTDLRDRLNVSEIMKEYPENTPDTSSYSISINASTSKVIGVSATQSITKKDINITNHSRWKYYEVKYDYGNPTRQESMISKGYLSGKTYQKGAIEYYTNGSKFKFPIKITSSFDVYSGKNTHHGRETVSDSWNFSLKT